MQINSVFLFILILFSRCVFLPDGAYAQPGARVPVRPALYEIYGDISGFPEGAVAYLYNFEIGNIFLIDSTELKNGKIFFRDSLIKDYQMVDITFGDPDAKIFYVAAGENHITATKGAFKKASIRGAPLEKQKATIDSLVALDNKDPDTVKIRFIKEYPGLVGSVWLLNNNRRNWNRALVRELYVQLADSIKRTPFGENIVTYLSVAKNIQIGDTAVDFTLPDINGKKISLSDFKGHYILLDFWGSWCVSCLLEIPYLKEAIRQYHQKGFDILGVSVESNRKNWRSSLLKYKVSWPSVSDLKGEDSRAVFCYGVKQFPGNYLISPDGIVIAKDLSAMDLLVKLATLFCSK